MTARTYGRGKMLSKRRFVRVLTILATAWVVVAQLPAPQAAGPQAGTTPAAAVSASSPADSHRALVGKYCVGCHNARLKTAGLVLDTGVDLTNPSDNPAIWEKVIRKVSVGAMPPRGMPRPDSAAAKALVSYLETELDRAAITKGDPGRVETFHRLNRAEYKNAIRDLLALDVDVSSLLPADDSDRHGFDNVAATLSVSPALLERYMAAGKKLSRLAVGVAPAAATTETYSGIVLEVEDDWLNLSEDLPFGSRGGVAIEHNFPVDGEYTISVRLRRSGYDYIIGLAESHLLDVRLDGALAKRFTVGGEGKGNPPPYGFSGNVAGDVSYEQYILGLDKNLQITLDVKAGPHVVGVSFVTRPTLTEGVRQRPETTATNALQYDNPYGNPGIDSVTIGGPFSVKGVSDTPSRQRLFVCTPRGAAGEEPCARRILSTLARRAYRRTPTAAEVNTLVDFYKKGRAEGTFEAGIQFGVQRVLADPNFIFRVERDPANLAPGTPYRLSDLELASRLSFFLWSSIPDDELLDLANRRQLRNPAMLTQQVKRMVADPRSSALVENFVGQWLHLRNLNGAKPDEREYPEFDEILREALRRETELFVESTVREDRSVTELITANYTFLNERLARHYGIPNISGEAFRRVTLTGKDAIRGGLLGHGSLLTVTSYPTRTSPVLRGKWLLETLLGTPPPPPPPNIPGLPDRGANNKPASVRERLEQHRTNPICANCHAPMDPLGFALEHFDGIGKWRDNMSTSEGGGAVDAKGTFVDGTEFEGLEGLRGFLLSKRDIIVRHTIEKMLAYALGRELRPEDMPYVRQVQARAAANGNRWSSVLTGIALSAPFQMRTTLSMPRPATTTVVRANGN